MINRGGMFNRRTLIGSGMALAGAALLPARLLAADIDTSDLSDITKDVKPIDRAERAGRVERAQKLMRDNKIDAIMLEPGSSMVYFSGVEWWRSERLTSVILPAKGEAIVVTPFFEEPSVRESLGIPAQVRVWQEDESPIWGLRRARWVSRKPCASSAATASPSICRSSNWSRPIRSCAAAACSRRRPRSR
jgi:hypothetical protein